MCETGPSGHGIQDSMPEMRQSNFTDVTVKRNLCIVILKHPVVLYLQNLGQGLGVSCRAFTHFPFLTADTETLLPTCRLLHRGLHCCYLHRLAEVERYLWKLYSPAQSRVSCSRLLRVVSSWVSSISRERDSTASLENLCQCFPSHYKSILFFLKESDEFCFVPTGACPINKHHQEESGSFSIPSHQVFTHTNKIPMSYLFFKLPQLPQLLFLCHIFHSLNHLCGPFTGPVPSGVVSPWLSKQDHLP